MYLLKILAIFFKEFVQKLLKLEILSKNMQQKALTMSLKIYLKTESIFLQSTIVYRKPLKCYPAVQCQQHPCSVALLLS